MKTIEIDGMCIVASTIQMFWPCPHVDAKADDGMGTEIRFSDGHMIGVATPYAEVKAMVESV